MGICFAFQLPTNGFHMAVNVCPLSKYLKLDFYRRNFQVGYEWVNNTALLLGAAQKKIYRYDFDYFDIAAIFGINNAVFDFLNGCSRCSIGNQGEPYRNVCESCNSISVGYELLYYDCCDIVVRKISDIASRYFNMDTKYLIPSNRLVVDLAIFKELVY